MDISPPTEIKLSERSAMSFLTRRDVVGLVSAVVAMGVVSPVQAQKYWDSVLPPGTIAVTVPVIVIGKVTAIEQEPVYAVPTPGLEKKAAYTIPVVKIDS